MPLEPLLSKDKNTRHQNNQELDRLFVHKETSTHLTQLQEHIAKPEKFDDIIQEVSSPRFEVREKGRSKLFEWLKHSIVEGDATDIAQSLQTRLQTADRETQRSIVLSLSRIEPAIWKKALGDTNDVVGTKIILKIGREWSNRALISAVVAGVSSSKKIVDSEILPSILKEKTGEYSQILGLAMAQGHIDHFGEILQKMDPQDVEKYLRALRGEIFPSIARGLTNEFFLYLFREESWKDADILPYVLDIASSEKEPYHLRLRSSLFFLGKAGWGSEEEYKAKEGETRAISALLNKVLIQGTDTESISLITARAPYSFLCVQLREGLHAVTKHADKLIRTQALESLARIGEFEPVLEAWQKESDMYESTSVHIDKFFTDIHRHINEKPSQAKEEARKNATSETAHKLQDAMLKNVQESKDPEQKTGTVWAVIEMTEDDTFAKKVSDLVFSKFRQHKQFDSFFGSLCAMQTRLNKCPADVYPDEFKKLVEDPSDFLRAINIAGFERSTLPEWQNVLENGAQNADYEDYPRTRCIMMMPIRGERQYHILEKLTFDNPDKSPDIIHSALKRLLTAYIEKEGGCDNEQVKKLADRCLNATSTRIRVEFMNIIDALSRTQIVPTEWIKKGLADKEIAVRQAAWNRISLRFNDYYRELVIESLLSPYPDIRSEAKGDLTQQRQSIQSIKELSPVIESLKDPEGRSIELIDTIIHTIINQKLIDLIDPILDMREGVCTREEKLHIDEGLQIISEECPKHARLEAYLEKTRNEEVDGKEDGLIKK